MSEIKADNLINGVIITPLAKGITLPAGTWERGTALGKVSGVYGMISDTTYTADTFDCILAEDATLEEEGAVPAYFTGEFNKDELIVDTDFDVDTIVDYGRKLNIFIK